jgi:folate-dependent tRNA-U54 methylase TrmFO/GidA
VTFGIMPPPPSGVKRRQERKRAISERALRALDEWMSERPALADAGAAP